MSPPVISVTQNDDQTQVTIEATGCKTDSVHLAVLGSTRPRVNGTYPADAAKVTVEPRFGGDYDVVARCLDANGKAVTLPGVASFHVEGFDPSDAYDPVVITVDQDAGQTTATIKTSRCESPYAKRVLLHVIDPSGNDIFEESFDGLTAQATIDTKATGTYTVRASCLTADGYVISLSGEADFTVGKATKPSDKPTTKPGGKTGKSTVVGHKRPGLPKTGV